MIRTSSSVVALCAALVLSAAAPPAQSDPSAGDIATAKSLIVEGRGFREKGNHSTARDRFRAAFAIVPTPIIGIDLAREHVALQELIEAREVAIAVTKLPDNPKESPEGRAARVDAAKLANDLAPRIGTLVLMVDSLPDNGIVLVDGAAMPKEMLGAPRKVNPGKHVIAVRVGDRETKRTVAVAEGAREELRIDALELGTGTSASLATGSPSSVPKAPPDEARAGAPIWPWVAVGAGGVGLLVSGAYAITALGRDSKLVAEIQPCNRDITDCDALERDLKDKRNGAWIISAVSGVIGVAGVVIGIVGMSSGKPSTTSTASFRLGPGSVQWIVTF